MDDIALDDADVDTELDLFYRDVAANDLRPLWTQAKDLLTSEPRPRALPWLWRGERLRDLCSRSRPLIPIERGGDRRVLSLANPGLGGRSYATPTLWGAFQSLAAGERAPAHRHSAAAIRFVLEGEGVSTIVNGDSVEMHPGDLILTPAFAWHDHVSYGDGPMIWFDGLDLPLVIALDGVFFENHPQLAQPVDGVNLAEALYGQPGLLPTGRTPGSAGSPLLVYRWSQTDEALARSLVVDDGVTSVKYSDPTTGGPPLPTISCTMHRLAAGAHSRPIRRTGSSVLVVFRGKGFSIIKGTRFDWERGDAIAIPSWAVVEHVAEEMADIFAIDDSPVFSALGLYREHLETTRQDVVEVFEPK